MIPSILLTPRESSIRKSRSEFLGRDVCDRFIKCSVIAYVEPQSMGVVCVCSACSFGGSLGSLETQPCLVIVDTEKLRNLPREVGVPRHDVIHQLLDGRSRVRVKVPCAALRRLQAAVPSFQAATELSCRST